MRWRMVACGFVVVGFLLLSGCESIRKESSAAVERTAPTRARVVEETRQLVEALEKRINDLEQDVRDLQDRSKDRTQETH